MLLSMAECWGSVWVLLGSSISFEPVAHQYKHLQEKNTKLRTRYFKFKQILTNLPITVWQAIVFKTKLAQFKIL